MSVVLFNCDSGRLPQAVVEKVGTIHEDDNETRCQVLLRHIEAQRLRSVYQSILRSDTNADAYSASEATQDFMAKLRISVIADQTPPQIRKTAAPMTSFSRKMSYRGMQKLLGIPKPLIRLIFDHSYPLVGPGGARRQPMISSPPFICVARSKALRFGLILPL